MPGDFQVQLYQPRYVKSSTRAAAKPDKTRRTAKAKAKPVRRRTTKRAMAAKRR